MLTTSSLSQQIQDISSKEGCKSLSYPFSSSPLANSGEMLGRFPFIDQVIYREWSSDIIFKETSTVFYRVEGRINWFKSKQDNNQNNPIFIDGVLNDTWWERVNPCCEYKTFREVYVAEEGQVVYTLPYTPDSILLVSINGQGPLSNINNNDYNLNGNVLTLKAPNLPSAGAEIVVIASYDNVQIIDNPFAARNSATNFFEFNGSYNFELDYFPIYLRSVRNRGYVLGDDLIQYFTTDKTVTVLADPPNFEFSVGDRIFIEYDYK